MRSPWLRDRVGIRVLRLGRRGGKENPMSTESVQQSDAVTCEETTREQRQTAAEPWYGWRPAVEEWLGQAAEAMVDMAEVGPGARVLEAAAGTGGRTMAAAKRVGFAGYVLTRDTSSNILEFDYAAGQEEGLINVETV
jgi:cyclopropane fatty-acyl-phospholipid synthase-like methyltransferase